MIEPISKPVKSMVTLGNNPRLSTSEFQQLAKLVYDQCGINLVDAKKVMLESRLGKRLRVLMISSFKDYILYLTSKAGLENEMVHMIDEVTTNKTDFFREPHHFDYLKNDLLPNFYRQHRSGRPYRIWSSACSTGEEPYTLAMVLQDFALQNSSFSYSILASDISTEVLQKAALAVYNLDHVAAVPLVTKQRYLLKSKNQDRPTVRVVQALREKIHFMRLNLMDDHLNINDDMDAIFCRNVLIYFDRKTQLEVVGKLINKLRPGGYLFIGHSESLHQFNLPITQVKPTVFVKN
jgi:chemotaxis protein methyltransferase CheR